MLSGVVHADTMTLFSDPKTGQVFTTAGEGRVAMGDFIDAKSIDMAQRESESSFSEYKDAQKKYVNVKSHAKTLEFSGTHYFGFTDNSYSAKNAQGGDHSAGFEMRRNYVQAKAYFNDKDYFRVTLDSTKELESGLIAPTATDGPANVIIKYAYLYLDKILPYTGVEIGIAHRPWIDYEEHNSWYYRSINKVVLEDKFGTVGVDTMNSADLGVNFQTKTPYFSSELGVFNGEGYHSTTNEKNNDGLSGEWRLTGHVMGDGEKVGKYDIDKDTYANISFAGLSSQHHKMDAATNVDSKDRYNRNMMLLHAVYNQPFFLIAAQYDISKDHYAGGDTATLNKNREIKSWSVNGEIRPAQDWTVLARFDDAKVNYPDNTVVTKTSTKTYNPNQYDVGDTTQWIYGVAYKYNKNVKFIASGKTVNAKDGTPVAATTYEGATTTGAIADKQSWMLTTEVEW
jgi:hypothetical protein